MTRLLRRLRGESGYSLVELLTVMAILGVVLGGLTALFVGGSNAQLDMNRRFEAQQAARLALDKMRREVHCASGAATAPATGASNHVILTLPGQCPTAVNGATTSISWCTVQVSANRFALYRQVGATCGSGGVKWADFLAPHPSVADSTAGQLRIFRYQPSGLPTGAPAGAETKARLRVVFPVDVKVGDATPVYALCDQLVLRNTSRSGSGGDPLPAC